MNNPHFELIARALVVKGDKILLCRAKENEHYYLPGGHVEFGEKAETALKREMMEEAGVELLGTNFAGIYENQFEDKRDGTVHEINFVFSGEVPSSEIVSKEDHIEFTWVKLDELQDLFFLPEKLKVHILEWKKNKAIFYGSELH